MRKINLKETGITLIALVVTIIVLLILAGVTISIAINNNGLIDRTRGAKEEHRGGTVQEQRDLWMTDIQAAKYSNDGNETLDELLQRLGPSGQKLLTAEEIETIRATGSVKIGSRTIDFTLPDNDDGVIKFKILNIEFEVQPGTTWKEWIEEGPQGYSGPSNEKTRILEHYLVFLRESTNYLSINSEYSENISDIQDYLNVYSYDKSRCEQTSIHIDGNSTIKNKTYEFCE